MIQHVATVDRPRPATRIFPKLWMGGITALADPRIDAALVALCAREWPFDEWGNRHPSGAAILRVPLDDSETPTTDDELRLANEAGHIVAGFVRVGGRVLVTCRQGRNRSGLVTALALRTLTGWDGARCVRHVREMRGGDINGLVRCRPEFVQYVERMR